MNILIGTDDLDPKLKICQIWAQIFIKFCTSRKSNMLIMNIVLEIDDFDPNFVPTIEVLNDFMNLALRTNGVY